MLERQGGTTFWKAFGPGLLWAGAAIGVSHLVQSTRAGASFGFALLGVIVLANVFKYPAFSFGPRYAAATGTSLLEGYRRQGPWALSLYGLLTLGTMFTVQGAVTVVTAALGMALLDLPTQILGLRTLVVLVVALTALCAALLAVGHYRWLDKIIKVVVLILTVSTFTATALILPRVDLSSARLLPSAEMLADPAVMTFVVALVGWMPSAFDISIWHSLWTLARRAETRHAPSVRESLVDFNVGYVGTALLALCFLTLGATVMHGSGEVFSDDPAPFANQVIALYTKSLGAWSKPIIALAAFTVMFSTTLTVVDGFPRALATLLARFREKETPEHPTDVGRRAYWISMVVLGVGVTVITAFLLQGLKGFVDVATILSFLTAPALAWLNQRAILGDEVPPAARPGGALVAWSWAGIAFSLLFALYYLWLRFLA